MKYRIKIIELNNGVKKYIPQIKTTLHPIRRKEWVRKIYSFFWKEWVYLRQWNMAGDINVTEDFLDDIAYDTEEGALSIIERYKNKLLDEKMKEVNNITYKYLWKI